MESTRHAGRRMSLEEYLAFEETSTVKHEYVYGEAFTMSGVTLRHNVITLNMSRALHRAARSRRCAVLATNVKLRAAKDRIYYPDLMVVCGKAMEVELIVDEPSIVVEVTSPSTRSTDRREKLDAYMGIASLRTYLIVDQRRPHVIVYTRGDGGEWSRDEVAGTSAVLLPSLGTQLALGEIYEDVKLPPLTVREGEDWDSDEWISGDS